MKKLLIFLFLGFAMTSNAQKFQLGAKGGVNISNYTGDDIESNALVGFHIGAFINLMFGDNLSLQPEVLFSTQGTKFEDAGDEQDWKVNYLNIPVMLKYRFNGGFFVEAGPQIGLKLSEDLGGETSEDLIKNSDVSAAVGLGFHGKSGLGIGARYNMGLSKIADFEFEGVKPDVKNSVIQLSIFYTLFNNRNR